ncbi:hypothetical protein ABT112_18245 [Streptomyces sp. NPDC002055]|uniref:hypothetical protein n=1 Tax=Streptomyces sp. NPDC002055 TaxID=3154534 RepID=UPI00331F081A
MSDAARREKTAHVGVTVRQRSGSPGSSAPETGGHPAARGSLSTHGAPGGGPFDGRTGPGVAMGAATAVVAALVLGFAQGSFGRTGHELGYWALAIGLLVGVALGTAGGRSLPASLCGIPLATAGVAAAQLLAAALQVGTVEPEYSAVDPLTGHAGPALAYWRHEILSRNDIAFYTVAALEGFLVARRVAEHRSSPGRP